MTPRLDALVVGQSTQYGQLLAAIENDKSQRYVKGWRFTNGESYVFLQSVGQDERRFLLLNVLARRLQTDRNRGDYLEHELLGDCLGRFGNTILNWRTGELQAVFEAVGTLHFDTYWTLDDFRFAVTLAKGRAETDSLTPDLMALLRLIQERVAARSEADHGGSAADTLAVNAALVNLLHKHNGVQTDGADLGVVSISESDPFGRAALPALKLLIGTNGLTETLGHLVSPINQSWKRETLRQHQAGPLLLRISRMLIGVLRDVSVSIDGTFSPSSIGMIKGAASVLAAVGDDSDATLLEAAARSAAPLAAWFSFVAPPRACIAALGEMNAPGAAIALQRLQGEFRSGDLKKRVAAAIDANSRRAGISPGQLTERGIDALGLSDLHEIVVKSGPLTARIGLTATAIQTGWFLDGKPLRSISSELKEQHADKITEAKTVAKQLAKARSTQLLRLEGLFAEDRVWDTEEWLSLYRSHHLLGPIVAVLVWQAKVSDEWISFLGSAAVPDQSTSIRLWHPLRATTENIEFWRDELVRRELRQPFKQVFREHYEVTEAERAAGLQSVRFAGHTLSINKVFALMKTRGWQAKWLGHFGGGWETTPRFVLAEGRYRIGLDLRLATEDYGCEETVTGGFSFDRKTGNSWSPVQLSDVPVFAFSEAVRDIDLFVTVCTVANDPTRRDALAERPDLQAAWDESAYGTLSPAGEVRRAALTRILPNLKISKQCRIDDRSLWVTGTLGEYSINLGTANVMMHPRKRALCIIQGSTAATRSLFLPFDDDATLSLILSKALMLANDSAITDHSIASQLRN